MTPKYWILKTALFLLILLCFNAITFAADEDLLFQTEIINSNIPSTQSNQSADEFTTLYNEKKSVNFSGQLNFESDYFIQKECLENGADWSANQQLTYTDTDIFLDIRHPKQIKTFLDLNLLYLTSVTGNANMAVTVKELFLDFNLAEKTYFRIGKQFINWGTTYFWNPVDFVNSNRRNFFSLNAIRGGTSGIRMHVPDTWERNLYFFINLDQTSNLQEISLTSKYVWVMNSSEFGLTLYNKYQRNTKLGLDISTKMDIYNIKSELAIAPYSDQSKVTGENDPWPVNWTLNIGRTFNWERANRIMANYEFFYNAQGYRENIFADSTKKDLLLDHNLYEMNHYAWAYHAFFVSINEFPSHSSQCNFQLLQSLLDHSGIASMGLTYAIIDELNVLGNLYYFFGKEDTEYLQSGNRIAITTSAKISF